MEIVIEMLLLRITFANEPAVNLSSSAEII